MENHYCLDNSPQFELIELQEIDSTNRFLRNFRPPQPRKCILCTAEYQTNGHGQRNNSWESQPGKNILMSIRVQPSDLLATKQFILSQALSLAIRKALQHFADGFCIKWPNDIYWNNKKVAGILIENDLKGRNVEQAILGVGINVNQTVFESDAPNPTSLQLITGKEWERRFVLEKVMQYFDAFYLQIERGDTQSLQEEYKKALYRSTGMHTYRDENGEFRAQISHVAPNGLLTLTDEQGCNRNYAFKEVSFVIANDESTLEL